MAAEPVIALPPAERKPQSFVHRRIHLLVVKTNLIGEGSCFPSAHPRAYHGHKINASAFYWCIPPNRLEAFFPKDLAGSRHVFHTRESKVVSSLPFGKRCSCQSELGIL